MRRTKKFLILTQPALVSTKEPLQNHDTLKLTIYTIFFKIAQQNNRKTLLEFSELMRLSTTILC